MLSYSNMFNVSANSSPNLLLPTCLEITQISKPVRKIFSQFNLFMANLRTWLYVCNEQRLEDEVRAREK